ncbi:hypothetical protein [Streptomyces sp. ODS28]|uniref:hypothetical protein n=1 Tax=Streptomyces sp. ODS28 TaxID=3136688 RepID=UPI0031E6061B
MEDQASGGTAEAQRWLIERADDAFTEVQRADTKAAALCGVTGGLLALGATVLGQSQDRSRPVAWGLAVVGALLMGALVAALRALRPALPPAGLHAALTAEAGGEGLESVAPAEADLGF